MSNVTPIDLYDDGVRLVRKGTTEVGGFPYIQQHNPDHLAYIFQEKKRRKLIQETNWIQWG